MKEIQNEFPHQSLFTLQNRKITSVSPPEGGPMVIQPSRCAYAVNNTLFLCAVSHRAACGLYRPLKFNNGLRPTQTRDFSLLGTNRHQIHAS